MNIDEPLTGFEPSARLPTKIERLTDSSLTLRRYGVQLNDHHSQPPTADNRYTGEQVIR